MNKLKIAFLIASALSAINCGSSAQQTNTAANANQAIVKTENSSIVSSHSNDAAQTNSIPQNRTGSTESPMARPIDTSELSAAIEKAQKNPKDKKALAEAYFKRAFALTEAAQYRSALGDFRRGLKLDSTDADAKAMHDKIIEIFASIGREPPKEGEEPPPLPFNSDKPTNQTSSSTSDERIVFKPNQTTATASGDLSNYDDSKTFVINVKSGQTLRTEQAKSNDSTHYISVEITNPNGEPVGDADASCNNRREISPTVAGDYRIKVFECRKADAWKGKFDLSVSVKSI